MLDDFSRFVGEEIDGRYVLCEVLGEGSYGVVYSAEERAFGEAVGSVALKVMRPKGAAEREAVVREVRAMAGLSHPNLVAYRSSGEVGSGPLKGCLYLATELAEGSLADELLLKGKLPEEEVRALARDLASALEYLHSQQAVHRDVKPANVLRCGSVWKLADFGLVRGFSGTQVSASGSKGTALYMSPEAVKGQTGPHVDVWALGVVLQQAASGKLAYSGGSEAELIAGLLTKEPTIAAGLPKWLDALVRACLNKERGGRPLAKDVIKQFSGVPEAGVPGRRSYPLFLDPRQKPPDPQTAKTPVPSPTSRVRKYTMDIFGATETEPSQIVAILNGLSGAQQSWPLRRYEFVSDAGLDGIHACFTGTDVSYVLTDNSIRPTFRKCAIGDIPRDSQYRVEDLGPALRPVQSGGLIAAAKRGMQDLQNAHNSQTLDGFREIVGIRFSDDGQWLAAWDRGLAQVWNTESWECAGQFFAPASGFPRRTDWRLEDLWLKTKPASKITEGPGHVQYLIGYDQRKGFVCLKERERGKVLSLPFPVASEIDPSFRFLIAAKAEEGDLLKIECFSIAGYGGPELKKIWEQIHPSFGDVHIAEVAIWVSSCFVGVVHGGVVATYHLENGGRYGPWLNLGSKFGQCSRHQSVWSGLFDRYTPPWIDREVATDETSSCRFHNLFHVESSPGAVPSPEERRTVFDARIEWISFSPCRRFVLVQFKDQSLKLYSIRLDLFDWALVHDFKIYGYKRGDCAWGRCRLGRDTKIAINDGSKVALYVVSDSRTGKRSPQ